MDTPTAPDEPAPAAEQGSGGHAALEELGELLQLRARAATAAAGIVVLLGVVLTFVAPAAVPATWVAGLVVGLVALLVAVAVAIVVDGADPVLRGPRHLRRDGHAVLGRLAGPDILLHGGPLLATLQKRMEGVDRLRLMVTGSGADASAVARGLGNAIAALGHTSLVIDLRAVSSGPGVGDVGAGTIRLGEAAVLAEDRPFAWIGAGADAHAAASAAAGVAARPPRDLELLLIVAPDDATALPGLLAECDKTIVLVPADHEQRARVTARLRALSAAGATPECVVVGGAAVSKAPSPMQPADLDVAFTPAEVAPLPFESSGSQESATTTPAAPTPPRPSTPIAPFAEEPRGATPDPGDESTTPPPPPSAPSPPTSAVTVTPATTPATPPASTPAPPATSTPPTSVPTSPFAERGPVTPGEAGDLDGPDALMTTAALELLAEQGLRGDDA